MNNKLQNFDKLINAIMNNQTNEISEIDYDDCDDIIQFSMTEEGQKIQQKIKKSFQNELKKYQNSFPDKFNEVRLDFDIQKSSTDLYAYLTGNSLITINMYTIFEWLKFKVGTLQQLLNWHHNIHYTLAHQLAHILDLLKNDSNYQDVQELHGKQFKKYFKILTGKRFQSIPDTF